MTSYSPEILTPLLRQVSSSNLTPGAKTVIRQLVTDAVRMSDKIEELKAELAKLKEQQINKTVNQPPSKKPEWDKGNETKRGKKKRKLGGKRQGAGNRPKKDLTPDEHVRNELDQCPDCGTDLTEQEVLDEGQRIIEDTKYAPGEPLYTTNILVLDDFKLNLSNAGTTQLYTDFKAPLFGSHESCHMQKLDVKYGSAEGIKTARLTFKREAQADGSVIWMPQNSASWPSMAAIKSYYAQAGADEKVHLYRICDWIPEMDDVAAGSVIQFSGQ